MMHQHKPYSRHFVISASALFCLVGIAKIISAAGSSAILIKNDPIIPFTYRSILTFVGCVEILIAVSCFFLRNRLLSLALLGWLSTNILFYRIALFAIGYKKPCACLGTLTESLRIAPAVADELMKFILAYIIAGCVIFFVTQRKRIPQNAHPQIMSV